MFELPSDISTIFPSNFSTCRNLENTLYSKKKKKQGIKKCMKLRNITSLLYKQKQQQKIYIFIVLLFAVVDNF